VHVVYGEMVYGETVYGEMVYGEMVNGKSGPRVIFTRIRIFFTSRNSNSPVEGRRKTLNL